jgi:hypothetical protein
MECEPELKFSRFPSSQNKILVFRLFTNREILETVDPSVLGRTAFSAGSNANSRPGGLLIIEVRDEKGLFISAN